MDITKQDYFFTFLEAYEIIWNSQLELKSSDVIR